MCWQARSFAASLRAATIVGFRATPANPIVADRDTVSPLAAMEQPAQAWAPHGYRTAADLQGQPLSKLQADLRRLEEQRRSLAACLAGPAASASQADRDSLASVQAALEAEWLLLTSHLAELGPGAFSLSPPAAAAPPSDVAAVSGPDVVVLLLPSEDTEECRRRLATLAALLQGQPALAAAPAVVLGTGRALGVYRALAGTPSGHRTLEQEGGLADRARRLRVCCAVHTNEHSASLTPRPSRRFWRSSGGSRRGCCWSPPTGTCSGPTPSSRRPCPPPPACSACPRPRPSCAPRPGLCCLPPPR